MKKIGWCWWEMFNSFFFYLVGWLLVVSWLKVVVHSLYLLIMIHSLYRMRIVYTMEDKNNLTSFVRFFSSLYYLHNMTLYLSIVLSLLYIDVKFVFIRMEYVKQNTLKYTKNKHWNGDVLCNYHWFLNGINIKI